MSVSRRRFVHLVGAGTVGSLIGPSVAARGLEARFAPRGDAGPPAADVVRLDSNENPRGAGRAALDAIGAALAMVHRYPDDAAAALRAAVARAHGIDVASVWVGCGSTDLLRAAAHAFLSPSHALVTAAPTYEAPTADATRLGAQVRAVPVRGDLRLDLAAMADAARGAGRAYL